MSKALELIDRTEGYTTFKDGLHYTLETFMLKDNNYTLFRYEDWPAWVIFSSVFLVLITFDNLVLNRNPQLLTVSRAIMYTLFWMVCAVGFGCWVYWWKNSGAAYMWMSGYMLEWMLSFDNLFVFHLIFSVYGTPDHLKHRPLYLGILGAVVFRLVFIFIGEYLMHAMFFMHFVFGGFLVYTGLKTVSEDDEDEDPSQQPMVVWAQSLVPFVPVYDEKGAFFVKCPVDEHGEPDIPEEAYCKTEPSENSPLADDASDSQSKYALVNFERAANGRDRFETRATMLFLVVICLELSDLLFAVDSVSAIVAAVNDLFLAYTSAVFAMLGLRATFFIIDVLVKLFSLLKYGVAAVLVFIGIKLIVGRFYHIPAFITCMILVSAIAGSMVASLIKDEFEKKAALTPRYEKSPAIAERIAKFKHSPFTSPKPSPMNPVKAAPKMDA